MDNAKITRTMIIGLDGATFNIIQPLVDSGKLPNIAKFYKEGSYGFLNSTVPDISPVAWTSFMTGKTPGKHGIIDFFGQIPGTYETMFYNASYRKAAPVWSILSNQGKKVCVINVPMTYPPDKVNGIMISGMDTPHIESDFIYPRSLRQELEKNIGRYILEQAERNIGKNIDGYLKNLHDVNHNRFLAAKYLLDKEDWDLFMIVFESTDRVQHNFWKYIDESHPEYTPEGHSKYGDVIFQTYADIDAKLGVLLDHISDDTCVIIMSDHGFGSLKKGFRLTQWLNDQGYLSMGSEASSMEILRVKAKRLIKPFVAKNFITKRLMPKPSASQHKKAPVLSIFRMNETKIFPTGANGNLCINLIGREPGGIVKPGTEYETLRDQLIENLKKITDPSNGKRVVEAVHKREELYPVHPESMPDLLISWASDYCFVGERELTLLEIKAKKNQLFTIHRWSGNHRPEGILFMKGKPIKKNYKLSCANITDIAPTVLAIMSAEIPSDMDGKVLNETLTPEFLEKAETKYRDASTSDDSVQPVSAYSEDEEELIKQRLQDLGYME